MTKNRRAAIVLGVSVLSLLSSVFTVQAAANDIYITQNGSGGGTSCSDPKSASFFNTSSNWGSGASQIGAGTTVHLCGTFTGTAGQQLLAFKGNGTAGNPITLLFEPGAQLNAPYWSADGGSVGCGGAICMFGRSYVTVDGGTNGIIQNTANGDALANNKPSTGVDGYQCNNCTVMNLSILNMAVKTTTSNSTPGDQIHTITMSGSHWSVHDNVMHDCGWCIFENFANGDTDIDIFNNDIDHMDHGWMFAASAANAATGPIKFHDNAVHDTGNWDTPGCAYHHDGIHTFGVPGSSIDGMYIYNNYFYGNWGVCPTGFVYIENGSSNPSHMHSFSFWNNVGVVGAGSGLNTNGWFGLFSGESGTQKVYNNTIIGPNNTDNSICFSLQSLSALTFENNLVSNCGDPVGITSSPSAVVDYNMYGTSCGNGNNCFVFNGSFTGSFASWKSASGYDAHAKQSNTPLLNADGSLQTGSPAISMGINLMSVATGNLSSLASDTSKGDSRTPAARSASGAWDTGAYKAAGGGAGGPLDDVYLSQSGSGGGTSCSDPKAVSFFNSSNNWGSGNGQISAGTTVHLCGTFSSTLAFQGGGTSGNPVTLLFESGAKFSAPHWGNNTNVISSSGHDWLIVDGGTNGLIEATNNGTSPTFGFQDDETGVDLGTCNNCIVRNLAISNLYVKNTTDGQGAGEGIHIVGSNNTINGNTIHDVMIGIGYNYTAGATQSNGSVFGNTIYNMNHGIATGDTGAGAVFNGYVIHDNVIHDALKWDDLSTNNFHHNGVIVFVTNDNSHISGLQIYNNYIYGDFGARETGHIFLDGEGNGSAGSYDGAQIYNNLLIDTSNANTPANGLIITKANGGSPDVGVYNNTMSFLSTNKGRCVMIQGAALTLENNIASSCSSGIFVSSGKVTLSDYDDWFNNDGGAGSGDVHSITADPKLDSSYIPQSSPVSGAGTNLTSLNITLLKKDKAGASRPATGAWDMGAYNAVGGGGGSSTDIYITQNTSGGDTGANCGNAHNAAWFNSASHWGSGAGQISSGDTVHLCGTFTGSLGTTILTVQASGTSGNPITIKWEAGALLTAPACSASGCISTNGKTWLVLDGNNTSPSIVATANGTNLANKVDSLGINAASCNNCEIKNLTINNIYIFVGPNDSNENGGGIGISASSNIKIHDNSFDHMASPISDGFGNGDTNISVYNNTFNHFNHGVEFGNNNSNVISNVSIYGNHLKDMSNWDTTADFHHHDGIFFYQNTAIPNTVKNFYVYDNLFDGDPGVNSTAWVYFNSGLNGIYVFDNIFKNPFGRGFFLLEGGFAGDQNIFVENNYMDCGGSSGIDFSAVNGFTFQNNAMTSCQTYLFAHSITNPTVNHNVYANLLDDHNGRCNTMKWDADGGICYDQYRAAHPTFDVNSVTPASAGTDSNGVPQAGSALIHDGSTNFTNLTASCVGGLAPLCVDYAGMTRPSSGSNNWDAGAYKFTGVISNPPVITSALVSSGTVGVAYTYQITATNSPTSYNATGLPGGLSVNTTSGLISGTPNASGTSNVTISATNSFGTGSATLVLQINPPPNPVPSLTSLSPSSTTAGGSAFTLTVNGSNFINGSVVRWNGTSRTTSFISGTKLTASILAADIATAGNASVTVFNPAPGGGTSNSVKFTIAGVGGNPPVITSPLVSSGTVGVAYSYQITATNNPTSFDATGLPGGLSVNTNTGRISGTPTAAGTSNVTLSASNAFGTDNDTLVLTITSPLVPPTITQQPVNQSVQVGDTATFSITASGSAPLSYQWQYALPGTNFFYSEPGATSRIYTTPPLAASDDGTQFKCIVTNSAGMATSNAASVAVLTYSTGTLPAPTLTIPGYLPVNGTLTASYPAGYTNINYQWTIGPAAGSTYGVLSKAVGIIGKASSANFQTASNAAPLASYSLTPGFYTVTVKAVNASGNSSGQAQANVTLVAADLSGVRVYPNPWRADKHSGKVITFDNLTVNTTVKIFTVSGHHVKTLPPTNTLVTWDLTNNSGDKVASGLYVYMITTGDSGSYGNSGMKKTGQVAVIK